MKMVTLRASDTYRNVSTHSNNIEYLDDAGERWIRIGNMPKYEFYKLISNGMIYQGYLVTYWVRPPSVRDIHESFLRFIKDGQAVNE